MSNPLFDPNARGFAVGSEVRIISDDSREPVPADTTGYICFSNRLENTSLVDYAVNERRARKWFWNTELELCQGERHA